MSRYHNELQHRLALAKNDEYKIADIRRWYLKRIISYIESYDWLQLSLLEEDFLAKLIADFTDWQKHQLRLPGVD